MDLEVEPVDRLHAAEVELDALEGDQDPGVLLAQHTGQSVETIARDTDRDNFMSAAEAKAYGLVDEVLVSVKRSPA